MKQMFVATVKHRQEVKAAKELREQRYRIHLPKRHEQMVVGHRIRVVTTLRFPGYIFIEFDLDLDQHGPINSTRSVGELICSLRKVSRKLHLSAGETEPRTVIEEKMLPSPLPAIWEREMRRHEEEEWEIATGEAKADPRADLHHGDTVEIDRKDHAMHGKQGEYSRTENGEALIHIGFAIVKIAEIDVKLIKPKAQKAA